MKTQQAERDAPGVRPNPTNRPTDGAAENSTPADALHDATKRFAEVREYVAYFISAKIDGLKVTARNIGVYAALGVLGLLAGGAMVVAAVVLLLTGAAHGIGAALGGMDWLGDLIIGAFVLIVLAVGVIVALRKLTNTSRKTLVQKYESRKRDQRLQFGHDVRQRAREK
ncbi:MAG: hypothetical protein JWO87_3228 [Phycisphaerales bacterium]|nr:hypothetical protein [Phycisphaerales bacterium]MDB5305651.1 hypothetical protein [Phycisphaerales bacterium]